MTSKTTMRRYVHAAGGYYSRRQGCWVQPGSSHNCTPWNVNTEWFQDLEDAYAASGTHLQQSRAVQSFGEAEGAYLRRNS